MSGPTVVKVKRPLRPQHARNLGEDHIEVLAPGQHEIAEDEVEAGVGQRHCLGLCQHAFDATVCVARTGLPEHRGRCVERDDSCARPTGRERGRAVARAAAEIEDRLGREGDPVEAAEHLLAQLGCEDREPVVARARARGVAADRRAVEERRSGRCMVRVVHARGMQSMSAPTRPSTSASRCAAESATRRRDVPAGTVGGRIAATK